MRARPDFAARRRLGEWLASQAPPSPLAAHVEVDDHRIAPDLRVRIYRPRRHPDPLGGVLLIHGGGMVMGSIDGEDLNATEIADGTPAIVVSVDYRLAPEHPYPAAVQDCYAALTWLAAHAAELGVDPERIALYGQSAGGGLAAATALMARDRGGPAPALQVLVYPMLDDRSDTPSSHEVLDVGIWDRAQNLEAWRAYLGPLRGGDAIPAYAAPARAGDLSGLAPAYVDVGEVDLFRDEDIAYAHRLMLAGVPCELHVYPGAIHATQTYAPDSALAALTVGYRRAALATALRPR